MQTIDVSQAHSLFSSLIEAVVEGDEIIITRNAQPIVKLCAVDATTPEKKEGDLVYGSAKGLMVMRENFDDPIEDFKEYM